MAADTILDFDFEWDPAKARFNRAKHRVTFDQAAQVFLDPLALTMLDEVHSVQEDRWHTIGNDARGKLIAVSHTIHETGQARMRVRLISAREATRDERRFFENEPR